MGRRIHCNNIVFTTYATTRVGAGHGRRPAEAPPRAGVGGRLTAPRRRGRRHCPEGGPAPRGRCRSSGGRIAAIQGLVSVPRSICDHSCGRGARASPSRGAATRRSWRLTDCPAGAWAPALPDCLGLEGPRLPASHVLGRCPACVVLQLDLMLLRLGFTLALAGEGGAVRYDFVRPGGIVGERQQFLPCRC